MEDIIKEILKKNCLSLTSSRIEMLKILNNAPAPISEKELEEKMGIDCDRATIYRNLNTLSEKGLLQRIMAGDSVKYKFQKKQDHNNEQDHVHFECLRCGKVYCMENLLVDNYDLPDGYIRKENQFLITGICRKCSRNE